ncbi:FAD-dependent monooxygenase [Streptomyces sp. CC208A]|uniref:FAD-dependent monooxygenase n=1 Tax=Streptomyces sp. CC208A TaxID=3044573 RepID=UPI0024A8B076|nr:FAD-dependent monooxygenase [Streptomyces sp. CC208A]
MTRRIRTQVGIIGAGPTGLVAASALGRAGIDHVVVERSSRERVEQRAGVGLLEQWTVRYLRSLGLGDRLVEEGQRVGRSYFQILGRRLALDYATLTGGDRHWLYPQHLLVRDLFEGLDRAGTPLLFSRPVRAVVGLPGPAPSIVCDEVEIACDFVIGCDGFRGITRTLMPSALDDPPEASLRYPYETLTMLAEVDRPVEGVVHAVTEWGFAGMMPRAPGVSRFHLQVGAGESLDDWPVERIQEQLALRLRCEGTVAPRIGVVTELRTLLMRSHISDTLRHGSLFLAGDAAHLLTPFGGKGANLAIADVADLARGLIAHYHRGDDRLLDGYARRRLRQIWQVQEFSDRLLRLVMLPPAESGPAARRFVLGLRLAAIERMVQGPEAESFARQYVGSNGPAA